MRKFLEGAFFGVGLVGIMVCVTGLFIGAIILGTTLIDLIVNLGPLYGLALIIGGGAAIAAAGFYGAAISAGKRTTT